MDALTVQAEYERLGFTMGWTFAMMPMANLATARAIIVGLSPGGDWGEKQWERSEGDAYFDDRWTQGSDALYPIQKQIQDLHALLCLGRDEVFAGQFIPFRSPRLAVLPNRVEAVRIRGQAVALGALPNRGQACHLPWK